MSAFTSKRRARRRDASNQIFAALLFVVALVLALVFVTSTRVRREQRDATSVPRSDRGVLVITASNWMYREFLANFACNLRAIRRTLRPVVYSLDRRTHEFSAALGLSSVLVGDEEGDDVAPGAFERRGARSFSVITKSKLTAVRTALKAGVDVLLSDADIFWCQDAGAYVEEMLRTPEYADADVLIQPEVGYRTLNSGFYYVKSNERTLALFRQLMQNIEIGAHDQDVVNRVFCDPEYGGRKVWESYGDVPFRCESQGAVIRLLPASKFPSGAEEYDGVKVFSQSRDALQRMCTRGDVVVIHNNFIRATKKKARFIQKGMWFVSMRGKDTTQCLDKAWPESAAAARTCGPYC